MWIRIAIGVGIGLVAGAALGYVGKCRSGTCPITSNPWTGALFGALIGGLLAGAVGSRGGFGAVAHLPQAHTEEEFERLVLQSDQPVLVDFYATWCAPCRRLAPTIGELSKEYEGRAVFVKVDVDRGKSVAQRYRISGIPTIMVFSGGQQVRRLGPVSASEYRQVLDEVIAASAPSPSADPGR